MADFAGVGLVSLMGRANYPCAFRDDYTCEEGKAARCPFHGSGACPATESELIAAVSPLVVTNYAKWTAAKMLSTGMSHFQQVIFDEGDECVDALSDALHIDLHYKEIENTLGIEFITGSQVDDFGAWKTWARLAKITADDQLLKARAAICVPSPKASHVKHFNHLQKLVRRLSVLSLANSQEWIADQTKDGYCFDPIRPARYVEPYLFYGIPSIVITSATVRPKTPLMLGQRYDSFEFREFDSDFPVSRCPIYYSPVQRVDERNPDNSRLWLTLRQWMAVRQHLSGIIHTISYPRQLEVRELLQYLNYILWNTQGEAAGPVIDRFVRSPIGTALISPSVARGYDFPDDLCRWIFMCKIPFEPPSKIVKAREQVDHEYRSYRAAQYLDQSFGRGMRHAKDWCQSLICDQHLDWFLPRYGHLLSRNFHRRFQRVSCLPQPFKY
jgi:Rad3-related DNA helicase